MSTPDYEKCHEHVKRFFITQNNVNVSHAFPLFFILVSVDLWFGDFKTGLIQPSESVSPNFFLKLLTSQFLDFATCKNSTSKCCPVTSNTCKSQDNWTRDCKYAWQRPSSVPIYNKRSLSKYFFQAFGFLRFLISVRPKNRPSKCYRAKSKHLES